MASASHGVAVVVADPENNRRLEDCLEAYRCGLEPGDLLIVALAGSGEPARRLAKRFPQAKVVSAPPGTLTPVLWALGLSMIQDAALVRTTIAPCLPAEGWRGAMVRAHSGGEAAVGAAIEPARRLRLRDWAIYFLRYRNYFLPFQRCRVHDVAGDAASYQSAPLTARRSMWVDGFWENTVNADMAGAGEVLVLDPDVVVTYAGGEGALRFLRQRLSHGIHFGRSRLVGAGLWRRLLFIILFVIPGGIFLLKIVRQVLARTRARGRFVLSLPWLCLYLVAWSLGEWLGAILGPPADGSGD